MTGILEGIKVVDLSTYIAMPAATAMFADWGAEVIKVEPLGVAGEQSFPSQPPPWSIRNTGGAGYLTMQMVNRNKKSLAVDLKKEAGIEVLHKLVRTADIFASNLETSTIAKLKADYATLSKINPRLIYCVLTAYGRTGPDKDLRGGDYAAAWARSGAMHQIGEPGSPLAMNLHGALDRTTGAYCAAGMAAALWHREKTGQGQEIEVCLYHSGVWFCAADIQMAALGMTPPKLQHREGVSFNPLWNAYRTKDNRWFQLQQFGLDWPAYCRAMERPDLEKDPRFASVETMRKHAEEIIVLLDGIFETRTLAEWERRFRENNVIYAPVATPAEVAADPQAQAAGFFADVQHPTLGKIKLVTTPVKFHQNPASVRTPAPQRGQDTELILMELGYSWEDIARLKEQEVVL